MTAEPDPAAKLDPTPVFAKPAGQQADSPEEELWTGRTSWKHFVGGLAGLSTISLLALIVSLAWLPAGWWFWTFLLAVLAAVVYVARITLTVYSTKYLLTTERLFIERGIISLAKDQTELIRVDDVRVRKRLVDRIFDLGTIEVLSTDLSDSCITIEGVSDPDRVAELVRTYMRKARKKSLFIESL